jgi:TonB family protein
MMISRILLLAFFIPTLASAQDPHVHVRYNSDSDKTVVRTDWMYLVNTPQQFMQLIFNANYKGQRLQSPPTKVDLVIWSFSREIMFKESKNQKLLVKTNGESWDVSPQTHLLFKGESKNGQDVFWEEKRVPAGQPSTLPKNAQIKSDSSINGIFMEQLFFQLNPEQVLKIANADSVEMQLGETKFELMPDYKKTARSFLSQIDPSSQNDKNRAESAKPPDSEKAKKADADVINGKAISLPHPGYPSSAKMANASGAVKVLVTVDETGKVTAAQAISGHPLLRPAAEEAARLARFSPTSVAGQAVKITGIIIYNFIP